VHNKFTDEDKVSFDEDYMACDLVINWAAEGLVLCFIHAVVGASHYSLSYHSLPLIFQLDMSPQDNDEHNRTHWTNWCGTPRMTVEVHLSSFLFNFSSIPAHSFSSMETNFITPSSISPRTFPKAHPHPPVSSKSCITQPTVQPSSPGQVKVTFLQTMDDLPTMSKSAAQMAPMPRRLVPGATRPSRF
jgi:hypothetical protein